MALPGEALWALIAGGVGLVFALVTAQRVMKKDRGNDRMIEILEMAQIHAERGEPCEIGELRADLREFLETMRGHERTEEDLIKRAAAAELRGQV